MQIRHRLHHGDVRADGAGFTELSLHVATLAIQACVSLAMAARVSGRVMVWIWRVQGGLALPLGLWLLGSGSSPLGRGAVKGVALLNTLLLAYALPGGLALWARRHRETAEPKGLRPVLAVYGAAALFAWTSLAIRQLFHGADITLDQGVTQAELWSWSGAWLALGAGVLVIGFRRDWPGVWQAGLGLLALVTVKVFVIDMSKLDGLWRVLSFLALGLGLIALGALYRRLAIGRG